MRWRTKPKDCLYRRRVTDQDPRIWLYLRLGPHLFRSFQRRFGGKKIFVPKIGKVLPCAYCPSQKKHIQLLREHGNDVRSIAKRFGISPKHVYAHLQKHGYGRS